MGSKGGIFSTSENTLSSVGTISYPLGAFSDDFTFPVIATDECAFNDEIFSRISSGQSPFLATTETSPFLSRIVAKLMFPCPLTVRNPAHNCHLGAIHHGNDFIRIMRSA